MAENIETLSMGLTVSTEQAAKNVDDFINQAAGRLNDLNQAMESGITDVTDLMTDKMQRAVNSVVDDWVSGISTLEESARRWSSALNQDFDEVLKNAEIMQAKLLEVTAAYSARAQMGAVQMGAPLSPEMVQMFEQQTAANYAYAQSLGGGAEAMAQFTQQTEEMIAALQEVSVYQKTANEVINQVKEAYAEMGQVLPIQKEKALRDEMQRIVETGKELGKTMKEINAEMVRAGQQAIPEQKKGVNALGQLFGKLATKLGVVALAYKALQAAQRFIKESVKIAEEAVASTVKLTIAVREHQRAVGELSPTVAEANNEAKRLSDEYDIQANKTRDLLAQSFLLTQGLKLSKEETFGLTESAVVLGQTFGKDPLQAMQAFTNFLNTGYTQGLQSLGFDLDEAGLRVEAIKRGYIEFGEVLDEHTLKMVGMELINERAAEVAGDLVAQQATLSGQLKDQNIELENQKETLGKFILPIWQSLQIVGTKALIALTQLLTILGIKFYEFVGGVVARIQAAADLAQTIKQLGITGTVDKYGGIGKAYTALYEQRAKEMRDVVTGALEDMANAGTEMGDELEAGLDKGAAAAEEFEKNVTAAMDGAVGAINKALEEYNKKRADIERDLARQMDDITEDFARRREKTTLDHNQTLADIDRDAAQRRAESQREYFIDEQRALEDHKIEMARLESRYLMDLEDAVRERDARAVLTLRRRYNLERKEKESDFELDKKRRKQDHELELKEIEYNRLEKRAKEMADFAQELADLKQQEDLRRKQAQDAAQDRLDDLDQFYRDRLTLEGQRLAESLKLNQDQLKALYDMLIAAYGPQGWVLAIMEGALNYVNQAQAAIAGGLTRGQQADADRYTALAQSYGQEPTYGGLTRAQQAEAARYTGAAVAYYGSRQRGGTFFATSPSMLQVGETPERVDITPLNRAHGGDRGGGGGGGRVEIQLDVSMEHGLMAEIADQTMNEVADVFINISGNGKNRGSR